MLQTNTTLRSRIIRGMGAQGFGQIVQVIIRISEVPLFFGFWGAQRYGEWLMLAAIPAYLSMSDGGFTQTSCRDITMRAGAGDRKGALSVYQSTWVLLLGLFLVIGSAAVILSQSVPLNEWLNFTAMTSRETSLVFLILIVHILLGFQGGLLNAGFWASGRYPQGMFLSSLTQLLEFTGMVVAVARGGGPVQAATGYLLGRIIGTGLMWLGQRKASPWLSLGFRYASISEIRRLMAPSFAALGFPLGIAFNTEGMRLLIGLVLGPTAVAIFVPLRTLSNFVSQLQAVIYRLVEPEIAAAFGSEKWDLFQNLYSKACQFTFWISFFGCMVAIPASFWILPIWTAGKVNMDWPIFLFLLADVFVGNLWGTATLPLRAVNQHKRLALFFVMDYGPISLALIYFSIIKFGIVGVAVGLFITDMIMLVYAIRASTKITKLAFHQWWNLTIQPPISDIRDMVLKLDFTFNVSSKQ